jgi:predicted DNA-binding transcriptional regulator AlpA
VTEEDLLTAEQAQAYLGVSRATFWSFVKRYNVPKYQVPLQGKRLFFKRSELDAVRKPRRVDTPGKVLAAANRATSMIK